jgi:hypothetical protein
MCVEFYTHQHAYEDGKDRVFRNVGIYISDAGELPRREHITFSTRRKFEIKKIKMLVNNQYLSVLKEEILNTEVYCSDNRLVK